MIKEFKNGNFNLCIKEELKKGYYNKDNLENFIHNEMFMQDLYVNSINGYNYVVNHRLQLVYDLPCKDSIYSTGLQGIKEFLSLLLEGKRIKLIALGKRTSKDLLQDLENGY